jgi:hypothetical protein
MTSNAIGTGISRRPASGTRQNVDEDLVTMLAERGRPVSDEGLDRARKVLADADERRDHDGRAEFIRQLRANAS